MGLMATSGISGCYMIHGGLSGIDERFGEINIINGRPKLSFQNYNSVKELEESGYCTPYLGNQYFIDRFDNLQKKLDIEYLMDLGFDPESEIWLEVLEALRKD